MRVNSSFIVGKWNGNRYKILKLAGQGAFGTVYKVEDKNKNIKAIKISKDLSSITREFNTLKELKDIDGIPCVYEIDDYYAQGRKGYFFVMDYIAGYNLKEYSRTHYIGSKEALGVGIVLLKFLKDIENKGYVYTDIKLENIILDKKNEKIVFIDFSSVVKRQWGIREFTPKYNMISWGIKKKYNHKDYEIFAVVMVIISLLIKKEISPLTSSLKDIKLLIKKLDINFFAKEALIRGLNLEYNDSEELNNEIKKAMNSKKAKERHSSSGRMDIISLIFLVSITLFLVTMFIGINFYS